MLMLGICAGYQHCNMQLDFDEGFVNRPVIFRINDNGLGPELLQQVFLERGWVEYDQEVHSPEEWNVWWRTSRFRQGEYSNLLPWQHINHFPSCTVLTKKDALCRNLRKMKIIHGLNVYNFSPKAFNLPNDYTKFVSEYAACRQTSKKDTPPVMWICKPAESSRGRGIFIFKELSELQYDCNAVVQQYINEPLLIGGYKFDIRIYVAIPSFHPLQIYIHEEGLVRFSTEKYDLDRLDNVFAHLTNTSINKYSPSYSTEKEEVGHGCKWTISQLRRYFLQNNIDDARIWQQITNIVILTILMQAPTAPKHTNCFELYGFDILIDNSLKAWLLEVNFSPALSSDCQADIIAKKGMLHDLMSLLQISETENDFPTHRSFYSGTSDIDTGRTVTSSSSHNSNLSSIQRNHYNRNNSKFNINQTAVEAVRKIRRGKQHTSSTGKNRSRSSASSGNKTSSSTKYLNGNKDSKQTGAVNNVICVHEDMTSEDGSSQSVSRVNSDDQLSATEVASIDETAETKHSFIEGTNDQHVLHNLKINENNIENRFYDPGRNGNYCDITNGIENSGDVMVKRLSDYSPEGAPIVKFHHLDVDYNTNSNVTNQNHHSFGCLRIYSDGEEDCPSPCYGEDSAQYEVKFLKGNMRGQGLKKVLSPMPLLTHGRNDKQTKITLQGMAQRQGKKSGISGKNRQPQQNYVSSVTESNSLSTISSRYLVPRNFSRLEAYRFPFPLYHSRQSHASPGKNGHAPLSRIPQKQVGKLFLIFPFNEVTQKLSAVDANMDLKSIIKEILKQDNKHRKADGKSGTVTNFGGVWSTFRS